MPRQILTKYSSTVSIKKTQSLIARLLSLVSVLVIFSTAKVFRPNDRLALMSNNSIEHLLIYLGVMAYGATACTIHVEMNALYIDEIIATIRPKIILFEEASELDLTSIENAHKMPIGTIADCNR